MTHRALIAIALAVWSGAACAQATISLDSFDLNDDAPAAKPATEADAMRNCIVDPDACDSAEFGGGAAISLDDVVNLGVVDRSAVKDKPQVAKTEPLPSIDLEILFAYDSDQLSPQAQGKLAQLAEVLRDPRFGDATLLFLGHTDGVGSAAYNQALSERRAQAVASYVRNVLGLPYGRIEARGMGFSRLKTPAFPESAANRRVQLVLVDR